MSAGRKQTFLVGEICMWDEIIFLGARKFYFAYYCSFGRDLSLLSRNCLDDEKCGRRIGENANVFGFKLLSDANVLLKL